MVERFARDGARVIAAGRRLERLQEQAAQLGEKVLPLQLDVRDRDAVAGAIAGLPAAFAESTC